MLRKAVPRHVVHLTGKPSEESSSREQVTQSDDQFGEAHNEQHIESPQGIQRQQSVRVIHSHVVWIMIDYNKSNKMHKISYGESLEILKTTGRCS